MAIQHMLTTIDNPFDPFTEFDEWLSWDMSRGYNSSAYLARLVLTSDELSEGDQMVATEQAIDEIVLRDPLGVFVKVSKEVETDNQLSHLVGTANLDKE